MSRVSDITEHLEIARVAIEEAEHRLRKSLSDADAPVRANKVLISEATRAAFAKLRAARSKLEHLKNVLADQTLDAARSDLADAEKELDRVLRSADVQATGDSRWVSDAVEDAFAKVRLARRTLEGLSVTDED